MYFVPLFPLLLVTIFSLFSLVQQEKHLSPRGRQVAVYLAPTKALCDERCQDWKRRFEPLVSLQLPSNIL